MKKILKSLLSFAIGVIILIAAYVGINEGLALYVHHNLDDTHLTTQEPYIYVENRENEQEVVTAINNVLDKIPKCFSKEFKSNWKVVVSATPPKVINQMTTFTVDYASGLNLTTGKTIWISANMNDQYEVLFAHEMGHFIAYELKGADFSDAFQAVYDEYREDYIQYGNKEVDAYNASSANEFYAMLCQEYICYPDYLNEKAPRAYEYMEKEFDRKPYSFFLSKYFNELVPVFYIVKAQAQELFKI